jgi:hypothetical protein
MKTKLKYILFSVLVFAGINSIAKEIPINKVVKVVLPIGVPSIIEFPFNIKAVKSTSFIYKVKVEEELSALQPITTNTTTNNNKNKASNVKKFVKSNRPILISRTKRILTLTPKKEGKMSLIIWGYKYPIILDLRTKLIKTNQYDRYIQFLDYSQNKEKAQKFEATAHEKIITKLIRYIYNNKIPQGYQYQTGTLDYATNGVRLLQIKTLIGYNYRAEEWIVQNKTNHKIILYPQMFYRNGIYAVSFENNKLKPNEKIKMFIIAKNLSKD